VGAILFELLMGRPTAPLISLAKPRSRARAPKAAQMQPLSTMVLSMPGVGPGPSQPRLFRALCFSVQGLAYLPELEILASVSRRPAASASTTISDILGHHGFPARIDSSDCKARYERRADERSQQACLERACGFRPSRHFDGCAVLSWGCLSRPARARARERGKRGCCERCQSRAPAFFWTGHPSRVRTPCSSSPT